MVVLAFAAAGCTSTDAHPKSLPTLGSPTAIPSASLVLVPLPAQAGTAFGAAAFVRFYYGQVNAAFSSADPNLLAGLGDPECRTCTNFVATAAKFRTDGQRVRGSVVRVLSAEAPPAEGGSVAVDTFLDAPAREVVRVDGSVVKRHPPDPRYHVTVFLTRVADRWLVRAVKRETA
jgi:hypothetical protein